MQNLWTDKEAALFPGDLAQRVYTSRLVGRDKTLVLHGGGNTSVKIRERSILGDEEDVLYVKGSGRDLEAIDEAGFSPVRLDHLLRLAVLPTLSDPEMLNEMVTHMTRASAPVPSVETILHAVLPHKYVDHTHADALLAVTNTRDGDRRIAEIYGRDVVVIPYVMPGFELAKSCAELFRKQAHAGTIGIVLLKHGIFSFGATARESYDRMIDLVGRAERYLESQGAWALRCDGDDERGSLSRSAIASLRQHVSETAGNPMVMRSVRDSHAMSFVRRKDVGVVSQLGPATPDHVIRTKRVPMLGRDTVGYAASYRKYFADHAAGAARNLATLDPAPRIILDAELGMCAIGRTAKDAGIAADIYEHTMDIIGRATLLGGYDALPASDIFAMEYWDLEQAKLRSGAKPAMFAGEVTVVTGAASGIGRACVEAMLARGAAVVGVDVNPQIESVPERADFLGVRGDLTSPETIGRALDEATRAYGGVDMLIVNAGIFSDGARIADLDGAAWRRTMDVNLDASMMLLRESHPLLTMAPRGGRVVVIGSKNVPAPGPGAAAYSASKAALTQLARVAALEWGVDNIRVNILHPNAVFDTAVWTEEVLKARASQYGQTVEEYRKSNVLRTEVSSRDVAELAAEMCGPLFSKTTGAQLPVDGGNMRVI